MPRGLEKGQHVSIFSTLINQSNSVILHGEVSGTEDGAHSQRVQMTHVQRIPLQGGRLIGKGSLRRGRKRRRRSGSHTTHGANRGSHGGEQERQKGRSRVRERSTVEGGREERKEGEWRPRCFSLYNLSSAFSLTTHPEPLFSSILHLFYTLSSAFSSSLSMVSSIASLGSPVLRPSSPASSESAGSKRSVNMSVVTLGPEEVRGIFATAHHFSHHDRLDLLVEHQKNATMLACMESYGLSIADVNRFIFEGGLFGNPVLCSTAGRVESLFWLEAPVSRASSSTLGSQVLPVCRGSGVQSAGGPVAPTHLGLEVPLLADLGARGSPHTLRVSWAEYQCSFCSSSSCCSWWYKRSV